MAQYVSGRQPSLSVGFPGITTNNPVLIVDGRIGVQTSLPTADVDLRSIRIRESITDSTGFTGAIGYYLTKDEVDGIIWTAVPPLNNNAIFIAEDGDIIGVSSFTGINIQSSAPSRISVSTNTSNSNFANLTIDFSWVEYEDTGLYTSRNIGIKTTIPNAALDVVGDGNFTGVITANKFFGSLGEIDGLDVENLDVSGISTFVGIATFGTVGIGTTNVIEDDVLSIIGDVRIGGDTDAFKVGSAITMSNGVVTATRFVGDFLDIEQLDVENLNASGVSTFVGIATFGTVGIGTTNVIEDDVLSIIGDVRIGGDTDAFKVGSAITMSNGIVSATTFTGDFLNINQLDVENLKVSGISTFVGIATFGTVGIGTTNVIGDDSLTVIGDVRIGGDTDAFKVGSAITMSNGIVSATTFSGDFLDIEQLEVNNLSVSTTGISTLGVVQISSGIITNTNAGFAVTVFGDLIGTASTASFATTAFGLSSDALARLTVGFATTAGNLGAGSTGSVPYQYNTGLTTFLDAPSDEKKILGYDTIEGKIFWTDISEAGGVTTTGLSTASVGFATTAGNLGAGSTGSVPYQYGPGLTTFLDAPSEENRIIGYDTTEDKIFWTDISSVGGVTTTGLSTASVGFASTAINLGAGSTGSVPYQYSAGLTTFLDAPSEENRIIGYDTTEDKIFWTDISSVGGVTTTGLSTASVGFASTAINLDDGSAGEIPYQYSAGLTTFLSAPVSIDQVLLYDNDNNKPKWDKVGLGTNTRGDYVKTINGTNNQIEITGATGAGSTPTIGLPDNVTIDQNLTVSNDLSVGGNIFIGGTTASLDVNEFKVKDKNAILGFTTDASNNETSSDTIGNGGGISIASTVGTPLVNLFNPSLGGSGVGIDTLPTTYKRFHWYQDNAFSGLDTDAWLSNYAIGIGTTQLPSGTYFASGAIKFTEDSIFDVKDIKTTGISTLGVVKISSGIITNTNAGVAVTVFGDLVGIASTAINLGAGFTGSVPYQYGPGITSFLAAPSEDNKILGYNTTTDEIFWTDISGAGGVTETVITVKGEDGAEFDQNDINELRFYGDNIGVTTGGVGIASIRVTLPTGIVTTGALSTSFVGFATTASNVIGGIASVTNLNVSGVSTFSNGVATFSDGVGIGTDSLNGNKLQIENYGINVGVGTFIASPGEIFNFDSFRMSEFNTAEYTLFVQTSSSIQSQKVLVMHDNLSAYSQEYAIMFNPNHVVSIGASVSGPLCSVSFTPETGVTGLVTYKFTRETIS